MFILSRTPDYTPFVEFMIHKLSVMGLCFRINDSGLFAWVSLTALSRTYFIICVYVPKTYIFIQFNR